MKAIGAGIGRTGTLSLKLALNRLGLGPCHHMEEVLDQLPIQLPLWNAALKGDPDWSAIYRGYASAVDWPTAAFYRELIEAFPGAKFILTHRSPESWADSFAATIYRLLGRKDDAPPEVKEWLEMASGVIARSGFTPGMDPDALARSFMAHNHAVKEVIPASQLLVYQVKEGWQPLCSFLGLPVPDEPFPRTNDREEFWDIVNSKT
jgi:hypothetical protein